MSSSVVSAMAAPSQVPALVAAAGARRSMPILDSSPPAFAAPCAEHLPLARHSEREGVNVLPSFQTERLALRPRTVADLESCLAMDRDPAVTRFIAGPWADPIAHRAFVEARIHAVYPDGMGYWSVFAADGFVGWILLAPLDLHGPEIEIGWRL